MSWFQSVLDEAKKLDTNRNGVPDYKDPTFYLGVVHLIDLGILKWSPEYTEAHKVAVKLEQVPGIRP